MRAIKFRAWDKNLKVMRTEAQFGLRWDEPGGPSQDWSFGYALRGDRFELMQFTGLHDRNEIEIYEGDIVRIAGSICVVRWDMLFAKFAVDYGYEFGIFSAQMEILGNVHQNPELLR